MGLFVVNLEETPTVEGLLKTALANLDYYSEYCSTGVREGTYKDEYGQCPPDYLVTQIAMGYIRDALEILNKESDK